MNTTEALWTTRDGCSIPVAEVPTEHLHNILKFGMRKVAVRLQEMALDELAAGFAGGDSGTEYFAEVDADVYSARAVNPRYLMASLARSSRYAPLVAEAKRRTQRQCALVAGTAA